MCSTCSAATARSSSTTWTRWGFSRYLPVLVYAKGAPDKAAYFGHRLESFQRENNPFWTPVQQTNSSGSVDTMQKAIEHIRKSGIKTQRHRRRDCRSCRSMPARRCKSAFADSKITDALFVLERHALRSRRRTN